MIKWREGTLEGVFGEKILRYRQYDNERAPYVILNVHGSYGTLLGGNQKFHLLANALLESGSASVVLSESSRRSPSTVDPTLYAQYGNAVLFQGKSFFEEVTDVSRFIEFIVAHPNYVGKKLILLGSSLGGLLSLYLAPQYSQLDTFILVGAGLREPDRSRPLQTDAPPLVDAVQHLADVQGKALAFYSEADAVFSIEESKALFKAVHKIEVEEVVLQGVDHTFERMNGEMSTAPFELVTQKSIAFIKSL